MSVKTIKKKSKQELKDRVIQAWLDGQVGSADEVLVLSGENSLAVIIPKTMYQAEIVHFKNTTNSTNILDQYLRSLLEIISDELQEDIEGYAGQEIKDMVPLIDLKAGYITTLYLF